MLNHFCTVSSDGLFLWVCEALASPHQGKGVERQSPRGAPALGPAPALHPCGNLSEVRLLCPGGQAVNTHQSREAETEK